MRQSLWPWALALCALACGSEAVVGGACRAGYAECAGRCVDLINDRSNCGACGNVCAVDRTCFSGLCLTPQEIARWEAGVADGQAGAGQGGFGGSEDWDAGGDVSAGGSSDVVEEPVPCEPPYNNAAHCGDCVTTCSGATPLCGLTDAGYGCVPECDPPLEACGGACVDKNSDEYNCGACGKVCPTGICQVGKCVGAGFGHVVTIGMDYTDTTLAAQSTQIAILANSILLSSHLPVRVLTFGQWTDAVVVARVSGLIKSAATTRGRTVQTTDAGSWDTIPSKLAVATYDVMLVFDQPLAAAGALGTAGTLWNGAVDSFVRGGGIVVALDGGVGAAEMKDLLTNSGILAVTAETSVTGTQIVVTGRADAIGSYGVSSPFAAKKNSVAFSTTLTPDVNHVFVVMNQDSTLPVVVHTAQ